MHATRRVDPSSLHPSPRSNQLPSQTYRHCRPLHVSIMHVHATMEHCNWGFDLRVRGRRATSTPGATPLLCGGRVLHVTLPRPSSFYWPDILLPSVHVSYFKLEHLSHGPQRNMRAPLPSSRDSQSLKDVNVTLEPSGKKKMPRSRCCWLESSPQPGAATTPLVERAARAPSPEAHARLYSAVDLATTTLRSPLMNHSFPCLLSAATHRRGCELP